MTDNMQSTILRRMMGRQGGDAAEMPLTSSRAIKLALTKAANDTIGLVLTVIGMGDEVLQLDDLVGTLDENLLLVSLERDGRVVGLIAIDGQLRAAMMEMQTVGTLIAATPEARRPTGTDKVMCESLLTALLTALPQAMLGTELDGWINGASLGARIESARAAGLALADRPYQSMRLTVDLGLADREGLLLLVLPPLDMAAEVPIDVAGDLDWDTRLRNVIAGAPASLEAILHRFPISIAQAQNLEEGTILPLTGCNVNSVRLISQDGRKVAQAKLGQIGGMRAIRIEQAPTLQLTELGPAAGCLRAETSIGDVVGSVAQNVDDIAIDRAGPPGANVSADPTIERALSTAERT